ncbi:hypothetical protein [Curtobacterium sp. MCBA15_004]|uniref:hypothetical protein n=1 Tax=Curtobacterium sp. MCBA15_004 TaxID=1898733 RepID=UPI0008DCF4E4|nr:hypothetical protein [Curtobacterium sp. MCBA15_004]WIA98036.1 hypothetical protein QOL16_06515 [Curtobacterium sp. MCBA15_004]
MTHADDAARLAKKVEKDNPAMAGIIHALLALSEASSASDGWHKLQDFDDLPDQLEQDYVFEYEDGSQQKWRLSADNVSSVEQFVQPDHPTVWRDSNDIVDQCVRWRYA